MSLNPYAPLFDALPETLPIFPLTGVLLLPTGQLPLHIFEPRYLAMINDALGSHRLIGMIQPREPQSAKPPVYEVGCAGKITEFSETSDGRYMISLTGVCRFHVAEELSATTPYRQVRPDWASFAKDLEVMTCQDLNRDKLLGHLKQYFSAENMTCDWDKIKNTEDNKLITCLSMVCPFSPQEKQALLEAKCCNERAKIFMAMLEMAIHEKRAETPGRS